jgi:hypothetical protein
MATGRSRKAAESRRSMAAQRLPVTFSEATAQNVVIVTDCSMLAVVQSDALRCAMT